MNFFEAYWTDVYKTGHKFMLPPGSTLMHSNLTPRSGRLSNIKGSKGIIVGGPQMTIRQMMEDWDKNFFQRDVKEIDQFGRDMTQMLMLSTPYDTTHMKELHALGYLPLEFKAIEEGTFIPYKVPMLTVTNTVAMDKTIADWLVNYLETILSAESWLTPTSATTAFAYMKHGREGIQKTDPENMWFLDYKYHDFSMRGMGGKSAIINSGIGFAMLSRGSDTLPVIPAARKYYDEEDPCINSVIATEHAIMCTLTGFFLQQKDGTWEKIGELEVETFRYLLKKFPDGILSVVSDTWNLWRVLTDYCVQLKDEILARDGKLVIRPDSGYPPDIMCGTLYTKDFESVEKAKAYFTDHPNDTSGYLKSETSSYEEKLTEKALRYVRVRGELHAIMLGTDQVVKAKDKPEYKGVIELLWDVFGGTVTSTGYRKLNEKVGAIYGDSITFERSVEIDERMMAKNFATTNYVLGVGSYSLQFVTRDTHGFAQKATHVIVNNEDIEIFKDPITDNGDKKSARGILVVLRGEDGLPYLKDQATWDEYNSEDNLLRTIYRDGVMFNETTLTKIRENTHALLEMDNSIFYENGVTPGMKQKVKGYPHL